MGRSPMRQHPLRLRPLHGQIAVQFCPQRQVANPLATHLRQRVAVALGEKNSKDLAPVSSLSCAVYEIVL